MVCGVLLWLPARSHCPVRDSLVAVAVREIGVTEVAENDGPRIREYRTACGFSQPVPWCACFIAWCYRQVGLPVPYYAAQAKAWTEKFRVTHLANVLPGDVATIYYSRVGRVGHAFIIERTDGDNVYTIEGNARPYSNDNDGDRVMRKIRPWPTLHAISNWVGDTHHVVQPGENLYRISLRYDTSIDLIKKLNGLNTDYIRVGDVLIVRCADSTIR